MEWLFLLLIFGGCAAFLDGCGKQESDNEEYSVREALGIPLISEESIEEEVQNEELDSEWIVDGATVVCTNSNDVTGAPKVIKTLESNGVVVQKKEDLCQFDSNITPLFCNCNSSNDGICTYNYREEIWEDYDKNKILGNGKYGLLRSQAYIVCLAGGGLIFATNDGQLVGDNGKRIALSIIKKWIQNQDQVSDDLLRQAGILASQNGVDYFTAIEYEFEPNFLTHGMQVLKDLELDLDLSFEKKREYAIKDENGNISVYPYYVGDGTITFGFGISFSADNLDPSKEHQCCQLYQYYYTVYANGAAFNGPGQTGIIQEGVPPIPVEELDRMFEYIVRIKYQPNIDDFVEPLNCNQNEYDALIAFKYNMGHIPENMRNAIVNSRSLSPDKARELIRNAAKQYYESKNRPDYLPGWMNRVDKILDLYFEPVNDN